MRRFPLIKKGVIARQKTLINSKYLCENGKSQAWNMIDPREDHEYVGPVGQKKS